MYVNSKKEEEDRLRRHGNVHRIPKVSLYGNIPLEQIIAKELQSKMHEQTDRDPEHQGAQSVIDDAFSHRNRPEDCQDTAVKLDDAEGEVHAVKEDVKDAAKEKGGKKQCDISFCSFCKQHPRRLLSRFSQNTFLVQLNYRVRSGLCPPIY